ncbi:hypothetical protein PR262_08505 [Clostridioides difficile]|nr:hypothetical protein [Clostridioides difficile]HBH3439843.1 hypothetical protein [Clostridioides difficile]
MVFWTIQSKKVIDILLSEKEYYPNFELVNISKYSDMKTVYPFILENYNLRNESDFKGVLFGFKDLNNKPINNVEDLYQYFIDNPYVSVAFDFWSNKYCILKVRVNDNIDFIPIDFNDFIKLSIGKTNDVERAMQLEQSNFNYSFNKDIENILLNFNNGTTNPRHSSFIQVHYSHLSLGDILGVYNMIDYRSGKKYSLNKSAIEIKNII